MQQTNEVTHIIELNTFKEEDGVLCPIEFKYRFLPFIPKRIFYVTDVPKDEERGNHAHYNTEQLLICVKGVILVRLFNGKKERRIILTPNHAIFVPKMIWDSQVFLTGNDVLLSLCSTHYNKLDYIEDLEEYKELVNE
jgi:hypothetical protein